MVAGPIQPMWNNAQNNLRGMTGELLSWNPDLPPWMAQQFLNNRLRAVIDRRIWSGLLVKDQIVVPDAYTTGTVTTVRDSNVVTGTSTVWPVSDKVNTTLSTAITDLNIVIDVTPVSMTGIGAGDWVTIDGNTGTEEQVLVLSVTATTFGAKCSTAHSASATVWKSSLVRQQFRINETTPWYTISGVSTPTSLKLNQTWGGVSVTTTSSYSIFLAYVTFGNDCKFVYQVANSSRRWNMSVHMPQPAINAQDPQRSSTDSTCTVADYVPDEIGRPQYELYPRPTSANVFPALYYRISGNLVDDDDTPPPFVRSDVLVMGGVADALRYRPKMNPYYDPPTALQIAREKEGQFEREVQNAAEADDAVYMTNLLFDFGAWGQYGDGQGAIATGGSWSQAHDVE